MDEIAASAATNKMTLYRHFESKDLLVAEYLRGLARDAIRSGANLRAPILAMRWRSSADL